MNLKIKYNYMIMSLLFCAGWISAAIYDLEYTNHDNDGENTRLITVSIVLIANYVLLKVFAEIIYLRIKYKDDGRELVSWLEFVTIHMTFPLLNAWMSYVVCY